VSFQQSIPAPIKTVACAGGVTSNVSSNSKFSIKYPPHKSWSVGELTAGSMNPKFGVELEMAWLKRQNLFIHPTMQTTFPDAKVFDYQRHLAKFGNYFTSSISWMLAEAIEENPDEIGIFGISMSSTSEYSHQKPGCAYLIGWARALGIKVTIQEGSELLLAPYIYGLEEPPKFLESLMKKKEEIVAKKNVFEERFNGAMCDNARAEGFLECIEFIENNFWAGSKR